MRLYENTLSDYINSLECSIEEFYDELAEIKNDPNIKDKKLLHFVNYLIACTDYNSFYKVMARAAKKEARAEAKMNDGSPTKGESKDSESAESKSESKSDSKEYK